MFTVILRHQFIYNWINDYVWFYNSVINTLKSANYDNRKKYKKKLIIFSWCIQISNRHHMGHPEADLEGARIPAPPPFWEKLSWFFRESLKHYRSGLSLRQSVGPHFLKVLDPPLSSGETWEAERLNYFS